MKNDRYTIIELLVNNHPGVLSHITGLFSRRCYNLEGILCAPLNGGAKSRMFLLLTAEQHINQVISQIRKLYDVDEVWVREDIDGSLFHRIHDLAAEPVAV
ncbi:MAG: ACT domain-containing protein [Spirochaetales bacterium]|nr:ACT domain-containing protein [Spirochaetales bacterium]